MEPNLGKILIYEIDSKIKEARLREMAKRINLEVVAVTKDEIHNKVGALAGLSGYELRDPDEEDLKLEAPSAEMVLFVGVDYQDIVDLLGTLREEDHSFPHKANLTPTTKDWSFRALVKHIEVENLIVRAYMRLARDCQAAEELNKELQDPEIIEAVEYAKALQGMGEDLSLRHIEQAQEKLNQALTGKTF
ncbi:MAG: DUF3783 domain-containing protein [Tissierellia bacterium]|nr:DUF3783 domain-containing protein [Tissierellia bacterium]